MGIFAVGAVVIALLAGASYFADRRFRRWRKGIDTRPQDLLRAGDNPDRDHEPPSTTWMYPTF